ncbi:MAG: FAD binding domain-containing protein [Phycisphaerae bacterium]
MYLPTVELHQISSLTEASALLERFGNSARLLAGGTDLLVDLKAKRVSIDHIISINKIAELKGISFDDSALSIGALTTITELDESPIVCERFPAIVDATRSMAVRQIRNLATVGGNLASAVPCADLPPILTAMNASARLWSPERQRLLSLEEFFLGARRTARQENEILSGVVVPQALPGFGAAYARFGLREGNAIAVASVAAGIQLGSDGTIDTAKVVLGAVAPIPKVAARASALLSGAAPTETQFALAADEAVAEADPISDVRGSAAFRRELVGVLTRRALTDALRRAKEEIR